MLLSATDSQLLVIDVQEKLAPAVADRVSVIERVAILMRAAARLGVPVLASEHYAKGIGHLVPELAELAPEGAVFEKISFSCARQPGFLPRLRELDRPQIVICGMEAHVCVLQSALSLIEEDFQVCIVEDAVGSRRHSDRDAALDRLRRAGSTVVTSEMVVFEWLERGDAPAFKELLALIK